MYSNKLYSAVFAGLLFYVVSNPITYTLVDSLLPLRTAVNGKPTGVGLVVHSVVFAAVTLLLMCM